MTYFCEAHISERTHFFISEIKPNNQKIKSYPLEENKLRIFDLDRNISILNSASCNPPTHNLLFIYMLLAELCIDEQARVYFSEKASLLAHQQVNSPNDINSPKASATSS